MVSLQAKLHPKTVQLQAELTPLTHDLEVNLSSSLIYAFSPIAKVELIENGNFLITITDKKGTTTAEVPVLTDQKIDEAIQLYLQTHSIIQDHNNSTEAHEYIRNLIIDAINQIPTKISQLQNDKNYVSNIKELIVSYNSFYDFPNIPSEEQRDMIFLDESTGDMYVFGLNNNLTYTSIGLANNDTIFGGYSSQN